jgi:hypothetical protein
MFQLVWKYPQGNFTGLGGNVLLTSESGADFADTSLITTDGTNYFQSSFGPRVGGINEGSSFVDCDVPMASPTPTPTATFTPTPTPTGTPGQVSQITPTGTTCSQFRDGTAATLSQLNYSVAGGKIKQNVTPGVFFYWVKVTVPAGNNSVTITQTITSLNNNFTTKFAFANGSNVFNSNCNSVSETITQNTTTGAVTVQFNAPTAGTYIIGIKYDSKSVVGATAPSPNTTVHYDFATTGVPGSTSGLDLVKN